MASIRKERQIAAPPEEVWDALRDWGQVHRRLVPGFAVDARLDGEERIVTFFNDAVAREVLIDLDEEAMRLVWSVVDGPYTHHNGAAQVFADGDGGTGFVWIADLLPDEAAEPTEQMMERGIETVKQTLESG
jgi:uncharacterized protein YndB with AHSA1/START domain